MNGFMAKLVMCGVICAICGLGQTTPPDVHVYAWLVSPDTPLLGGVARRPLIQPVLSVYFTGQPGTEYKVAITGETPAGEPLSTTIHLGVSEDHKPAERDWAAIIPLPVEQKWAKVTRVSVSRVAVIAAGETTIVVQ